MMRLLKIKNTLFCVAILSLSGCRIQPETERLKKPNIILINVDDLGWKDLGFMGSSYYETPHIDALAKKGLVFNNAYAGAANCAPSRACMISGLNTPRHGVFTVSPSDRGNKKTRKLIPVTNTKHLKDSLYTLPEMLKSAGYVTGNFGKWHLSNNPLQQGIDINIGGSGRGNPGKGGYFSPYKIDFIKNGPKGEYLTDRLTEEAMSFVEKFKDTTFFVYLPYYTVHTPILGKEHFIERFKNKKGSNGQNRPDYAAMIASLDENIGKLLASVKANGLERNTIVMFTSDNGGINFVSNQAPLRAGKGSYYEGGIRVPLIIKWPNHIAANTHTNQNVSHLDFYPTLQNIVQPEKRNDFLDGIDLNATLKGGSTKSRDLFFHFPIYLQAYKKGKDESRDSLFRTRPGSVVISEHWKLHHYFEDDALELYNLKNDIGEKNNISNLYPKKTEELYRKLESWRLKTKAPIPTEKNPDYSSQFVKMKRPKNK